MSRSDTDPEAHRLRLDILRKLGPLGRLRKGLELTETSLRLLARGVRLRHPEYSAEEVRLAVIRLRLPDELFLQAYPEAAHIRP